MSTRCRSISQGLTKLLHKRTLIKVPAFQDPSYVNSLQTNKPGTDQATPTYIRWTLIKVPAFQDPSYVNSLQANQPGTDQATPTYIRWNLSSLCIAHVIISVCQFYCVSP